MSVNMNEPTDVLIVGAGPTGLVTAALLDRLGVTTRILDPHTSRLSVPKAHVLGPVSLDVCAQAGIDLDLVRTAARAPGQDDWVSIRKTLFGAEPTRLPYEYQSPDWTARIRLNLAQPRFEAILEEEVRTRESVDYVTGRWIEIRDDSGVIVSTALVDGKETELVSRYLLAADGVNSTVRTQQGIPLNSYGPSTMSLSIHVHADLRPYLDDPTVMLAMTTDPSAAGGFILYDLSSEATFVRFDIGDLELSEAEAADQVRRAFGRDDVPFEVRGTARWEMAAEVADQFQLGSVFLLGDAAHRLPPTGGLGMNSGIQDGANLAWKIAAVLNGWAHESLLETYERERQPIAVTYTSQSSQNAKQLRTVVGAGERSKRPDTMPEMTEEQWVGFNCPGLQLNYGYAPGQRVDSPGYFTPSADIGRRLPHTLVDLSGTPVVDLVDGAGFTLFTSGFLDEWVELTAASPVPVSVVLIDRSITSPEWLNLTGLSIDGAGLFVRPDAHIIERCSSPVDWQRARETLAAHARSGTAFPISNRKSEFRAFVPPPGHPRYDNLGEDVVTYSDKILERLDEIGLPSAIREATDAPFVGVTCDGLVEPNLFPRRDEGAPTAANL